VNTKALLDELAGMRARLDGLKATLPPRETPVTLHIWLVKLPDGRWLAQCPQHEAWKFEAQSVDEAKTKGWTSLKRHHSRMLRSQFYIVGDWA
jgi:hypothetical protein